MVRKSLAMAVLVCLLAFHSTKALAWGGCHSGYTHVGPAGVTHVGSTSAWGGSGGFHSASVSHYGAGGDYHAGYAGGYHYGSACYGGFHAAGVSATTYQAGVYRAW